MMDLNQSDAKFFENLLKPIKDAINNLPTKKSLENLPTKGDLNNEMQQLFESVTIYVNEELQKRDNRIDTLKKEFDLELKKRDEHIDKLGRQLHELVKNEKRNIVNTTQDNFIEEKFSSRSDEKEDVDVVLIGDSIIRHVDLDRVNPNQTNKKFCQPGGKIENANESLKDAYKKYNMKRLIICTGTNHIPKEDPATVSEKIINMVRNAKINMPDTKIFVSGILPKYGNSYAPGINYINRKINAASKIYKFDFIYNLQFQENGKQNTYFFAQDKLHLSKKGVARLAMNFKYRLKKCS